MRKIFYLFAALSLLLLVSSIYNLVVSSSISRYDFEISGKGFDTSVSNSDYDLVKKKLLTCIKDHKIEEDKNQQIYFWLNFAVTLLTASSTFVTTIQASKKNNEALPVLSAYNKFAITIALLTFLSTLTNYVSTHYNDKKNNAGKSVIAATQDLNDFYRKYDSAKSDEERNKVTNEYDQKICAD
ncbi:hypothetical protein SAMN05444671_4299 [Flavobacterium sp. CF108]|uniref:hypothetical protein n=1 Tax=Flavobacterium sp. CF108 TaxID=1882758 RepID=UPI000921997E|nr:hypothetical protein [Flavobacterium sp. CF108]SHH92303.1 hypothetical protein SAMN05444671_4299 [Flavobacterium sp. CF108]